MMKRKLIELKGVLKMKKTNLLALMAMIAFAFTLVQPAMAAEKAAGNANSLVIADFDSTGRR